MSNFSPLLLEELRTGISHFPGRAGLVCTSSSGGLWLFFWLLRILCPIEVSRPFMYIATDLGLWLESLLELLALVLLCLALALQVTGRRTCWPCLCCDVQACFPSLFSLSSRLIISFPLVTAHCTPDGQFSIAVSRDVTLPPIILDSVQLTSGHSTGCVPVMKNNAFVVYQFSLSACGTTFQVRSAAVTRLD